MKNLRLIVLLTAFVFSLIACGGSKPAESKNTNTATANANTATKPADTKPVTETKAELKPTATAPDGDNIFTHAEAGIQFETPKGWKVDKSEEVITVTAPDSAVSISFWVPKEADVETAAKALDVELAKAMTNIQTIGKATKTDLNGMESINVEGTGVEKTSHNTINWSAHIISAKKPVFAVYFGAPGKEDAHEAEVTGLIKSIKKVA